ncbi:MAG: sulfatase [Nocardioidaceae bacterium]|nr:sulfatase [Nocardioidaceae bacterium]
MTLRKAWMLATAALAAGTLVAVAPVPADDQAAATPSTAPNIVLILTDDQSYESVRQMPYVSSQDWVKFPNAYAENALCCPARASILSGQYDWKNKVVNNSTAQRLDETNTIATWLNNAGYRTALVGKYFNAYPFGEGLYTPPGWDEWHAVYGMSSYNQYHYTINDNGVTSRYGTAETDYLGDQLINRAVDFIDAVPPGQPLFLSYTPTSTHSPWIPAPRDVGAFKGVAMPKYANLNEEDVSDKPAWVQALPLLDLKDQNRKRRREWTATLNVDLAVKEIDAALAATGRLDNTVVIFMTDNGYAFGAHRERAKRCPYEECAHLPFLVRYPHQAERVNHRLVSIVDVASTLADIAGVTPTIPQDGRSLVPLITRQKTSWRDAILQHWIGSTATGGPSTSNVDTPIPAFWGLRTRRYRYVELETGEKELYDLRHDPFEMRNGVNDEAYTTVVVALAAKLDTMKGPDMPVPAVVITNQPRD